MTKYKNIYKNFLAGKKYLKLLNFFHFEKINPEEISLTPDEKCLLLSPHFDDETFGCGGILIKYPQNFHIICLTDGKFGTVEDDNAEIVNVRKQEFEGVMKELGINSYEYLDIQDGKLVFNYEIFKKIDVSDFDYVFIPNYFDNHKDHKAVTLLLRELLKAKKHKATLKIAFYEIWSALTLPNYYLDITNIIKRKRELIQMYSSQNKNLWFFKGIISLNAYRGMLVNRGWAEMYTILDVKLFKKIGF